MKVIVLLFVKHFVGVFYVICGLIKMKKVKMNGINNMYDPSLFIECNAILYQSLHCFSFYNFCESYDLIICETLSGFFFFLSMLFMVLI
jgi:hypothetical protein